MDKSLDILLWSHLISSEKKIKDLRDIAFEYTSLTINEKVGIGNAKNILDVLEEGRESLLRKTNDIVLYDYTKENIKRYLGVDEGFLLSSVRKVEMPISIVFSKNGKKMVLV